MKTPARLRRRQQLLPLRIVEERRHGTVRFKVAGYYVGGKRARKYFLKREHAKTFIEGEQIRRENLGNRAHRIDGALAEDAIRAAEILRGSGMTVYDAARMVADSATKLNALGATTAEAVDFYLRAQQVQATSVTIEKLVSEFLDNRKAKGKSRAYLYDLTKRLERFCRDLGSSRLVCNVGAAEVDSWLHGLGVGPQSINNFRAVLSAAWGFAGKRGYAAENIIARIDKVKVSHDTVATFSSEEVARLLNAASFEVVPYLAIGVFAGLRPEELKRLRWFDVSFSDHLITVNASVSKTARKRFAELPGNLLAWLQPFAGRTGPVVCPNLQKLVRQARRDAGIPSWPPDVLRHTFASAHYAHFKNPAHTALLLGHRDQTMLMLHYRNLMKPADAAHYWQIMPPEHEKNIIPIASAIPQQA